MLHSQRSTKPPLIPSWRKVGCAEGTDVSNICYVLVIPKATQSHSVSCPRPHGRCDQNLYLSLSSSLHYVWEQPPWIR